MKAATVIRPQEFWLLRLQPKLSAIRKLRPKGVITAEREHFSRIIINFDLENWLMFIEKPTERLYFGRTKAYGRITERTRVLWPQPKDSYGCKMRPKD